MESIPRYAVEYFLYSKTRPDALDLFANPGGILCEVWGTFAEKPNRSHRVLIAPAQGTTAVALAALLHRNVTGYRRTHEQMTRKAPSNAVPFENFVAISLYLDELLRIVLPMTAWWHRNDVEQVRSQPLQAMRLREALIGQLGHRRERRLEDPAEPSEVRVGSLSEATPLAALIGLFIFLRDDPSHIAEIQGYGGRSPDSLRDFQRWVFRNAELLADAAIAELRRPKDQVAPTSGDQRGRHQAPELIRRVFMDREATLAVVSGLRTIKADAAERVFDVRCNSVTWAVIDSGIYKEHPAFLDHAPTDNFGRQTRAGTSRVRRTYDLTQINRILSFDLTLDADGTPERDARIHDVAGRLAESTGRAADPNFVTMAKRNLATIARQLDEEIVPDWGLIDPLIRLDDNRTNAPASDHGTHVAGILGADWRSTPAVNGGAQTTVMRGVCPDINLFDFRVLQPKNLRGTESALLAAMDFIRYLHDKTAGVGPLIDGVNISMSIPHDVRNYGCGATPICLAADRLVDSGVVVVAAAGNRGWVDEETGFGTFVMCSITDPGNAHKVITVGSTHRDEPHTYGVSFFSSRGPTGDGRLKPDLLAPGERVRGPVLENTEGPKNGTSMSAPFVSGAAAMLLARHPELSRHPARIKQVLCDSATDLGRERYFQGHGLLDVLRALQSV